MIPMKVREAIPQEKNLDWAGWTNLHIHKNLSSFLSVSQPDLQILGPWSAVSISQTRYRPLEKKMSGEHGQNWKCKRKDWQLWKCALWLRHQIEVFFFLFQLKEVFGIIVAYEEHSATRSNLKYSLNSEWFFGEFVIICKYFLKFNIQIFFDLTGLTYGIKQEVLWYRKQ